MGCAARHPKHLFIGPHLLVFVWARAELCVVFVFGADDVLLYALRNLFAINMGNHPSNHVPLDRANVGKFGDVHTVSQIAFIHFTLRVACNKNFVSNSLPGCL